MKKIITALFAAAYAVAFPIACISSSYDTRFKGYFAFHSAAYTYYKYLIIIVLLFILVFLNKRNYKFLSIYTPIATTLITICVYLDYFYTYNLLYNFAYALWIGATISIANGSVFLSGTIFIKDGYKKFYKNFWLGFTLIYIFILYVAFIRTPNSFDFSVNTQLGNGTFKYFKYIISTHPDRLYISLLCIGNILVFLPMPFIIRNFIKKIPIPVLLLIGFILPILAEGYQYVFKCGNVDIDDLILNWSGFAIGLVIENLIQKKLLCNKKTSA